MFTHETSGINDQIDAAFGIAPEYVLESIKLRQRNPR
jgi:hypothetical protein